LLDNGTPFLTRVGIDQANPNTTITDTNLHHFAVTKAGSAVVFYIDSVAFSVPAYVTTYTFSSSAAIGARGDNLANSFLGRIDEASVYNRALSAGEILSVYNAGSFGKCVGQIAPVFLSQPADKSLTVGSSATFSVTVAGRLRSAFSGG